MYFFLLRILAIALLIPALSMMPAQAQVTKQTRTVKQARLTKQKAAGYQPKYSAIVLDAQTGAVLHEEESDGIRHPASLTKMMTLYMLFEAVKSGKVKADAAIFVSEKASRQAPSKLNLQPGQTISVRTAILALVTKSANDVAVAVGEHIGGSEEAFARKMTLKAQALGMLNTTFQNASGLPNSQQVTTARDMATLSRALYLDFPREYKYFATQSFSHKGNIHNNHNHLLGKVNGVDGIKTGWIVASGFNLAASAIRYDAQNRPHRLIAVVLGGPNRHWRDRRVEELLENHFAERGLPKAGKGSIAKLRLPEKHQEDKSNDLLNELVYEVNTDNDSEPVNDSIDDLESVIIETISENDTMPSSSHSAPHETMPTHWVVPKVNQTTNQTTNHKQKKIKISKSTPSSTSQKKITVKVKENKIIKNKKRTSL